MFDPLGFGIWSFSGIWDLELGVLISMNGFNGAKSGMVWAEN
jgi:hypothetical protein